MATYTSDASGNMVVDREYDAMVERAGLLTMRDEFARDEERNAILADLDAYDGSAMDDSADFASLDTPYVATVEPTVEAVLRAANMVPTFCRLSDRKVWINDVFASMTVDGYDRDLDTFKRTVANSPSLRAILGRDDMACHHGLSAQRSAASPDGMPHVVFHFVRLPA